MLLIATALSLLAITAGMFLLAKTQKEEFGKIFKYASYFVVSTAFLCLICIGARGMRHCCMGGNQECRMEKKGAGMPGACPSMMEQGESCDRMMMQKKCHKGMMKNCCCSKGGMCAEEGEENEGEEMGKCCKKKKEKCCTMGKENVEIDSVVVKKVK